MITPTIMIMDVPPKDTFALNSPFRIIGMIATIASPIVSDRDDVMQMEFR